MIRPTFEVADILRVQGDRFLDRYRSSFGFQQLKAFRAILRCRTAALGGHRDACPSCGHQAISYNSCRNRHCPKCQTHARERWLAARERELLTTSYFHVVFTVPHELNGLALASLWPTRNSLQISCAACIATTGSSMPNPPSVVPCRCYAISAATPIAWRFPIIACWPSPRSSSPFAGRIMLTVASKAR